MERAIHISSINREKTGENRPDNSLIKFKPSLKLDPNITNSIDVLNINTTAINDSIVDGINTNTIAMIPTDNLTRSYPFTFEPRRPLYCPVSSNTISEMRFYVTDSLGRPVDFNGIDWFMTLLFHLK